MPSEPFLCHAMVEVDSGLVGIASGDVQEGDRLVLLHGIASLFIARSSDQRGGVYSLVGRVMIHDDMARTMRRMIDDGSFVEAEMLFQ